MVNEYSANRFPSQLFQMLDGAETDHFTHIASWSSDGTAFTIRDPDVFCERIMPKYFKQTKFRSFTRQLYLYGFKKVSCAGTMVFSNPRFLRAKKEASQSLRTTKWGKQAAAKVASNYRKLLSNKNHKPRDSVVSLVKEAKAVLKVVQDEKKVEEDEIKPVQSLASVPRSGVTRGDTKEVEEDEGHFNETVTVKSTTCLPPDEEEGYFHPSNQQHRTNGDLVASLLSASPVEDGIAVHEELRYPQPVATTSNNTGDTALWDMETNLEPRRIEDMVNELRMRVPV